MPVPGAPGRWYGGADGEGDGESLETDSASSSRRVHRACARRADGAGGVRRRQPPGCQRTGSDLPHEGHARELPAPAGGGAAGETGNRGPQPERPDGAQGGRHGRLPYLQLALCRAGRPAAPDLGDRTGPRADRQPAGRKPGSQRPRGRCDGGHQNVGPAQPRTRPRGPLRLGSGAGQARHLHAALRLRGGSLGQVQGAPGGRQPAGVDHRPHHRQAPGDAREPGNGEGRSGPLHPAL